MATIPSAGPAYSFSNFASPACTCFTYGQCGHRNITNSPLLWAIVSSVMVLPEIASGSEKAGALVPSASIVDSTAAMTSRYQSPLPTFFHHRLQPSQRVVPPLGDDHDSLRSEEHTSELQSLRHLVCRL